MGRRGVVFVRSTTHHMYHFPSIDFSQTFTNTCPGGGSRHMVSHSRKVFTKGSNFPKNPSFQGTKRYHVCAQATGHGKRSAMPRLSPRPGGHPTDVPFLGVTFAEGCTVFQLSTSARLRILCHGVSNGNLFHTYSPGGATIGSMICTNIACIMHTTL